MEVVTPLRTPLRPLTNCVATPGTGTARPGRRRRARIRPLALRVRRRLTQRMAVRAKPTPRVS